MIYAVSSVTALRWREPYYRHLYGFFTVLQKCLPFGYASNHAAFWHGAELRDHEKTFQIFHNSFMTPTEEN